MIAYMYFFIVQFSFLLVNFYSDLVCFEQNGTSVMQVSTFNSHLILFYHQGFYEEICVLAEEFEHEVEIEEEELKEYQHHCEPHPQSSNLHVVFHL